MTLDLITWLSIALQVAVLWRLRAARLVRKYPSFGLMLIIGVTRDVVLAVIAARFSSASSLYSVVYSLSNLVWLLSQGLSAIEGYRSLAKLYTGMGRFAAWLYISASFTGGVICYFCNQYLPEVAGHHYFVEISIMCERSATLVFACAMIGVTLFLAYFPKPVRSFPENLVSHLSLLTTCFAIEAVYQIVIGRIADPRLLRTVESGFFLFICSCYVGWTVALRPGGESFEPWPSIDRRTQRTIKQLHSQLIVTASTLRSKQAKLS